MEKGRNQSRTQVSYRTLVKMLSKYEMYSGNLWGNFTRQASKIDHTCFYGYQSMTVR